MNPNDPSQWPALVAQLGFPIFIAAWLLLRNDAILRDLTEALRELKQVIEKQMK